VLSSASEQQTKKQRKSLTIEKMYVILRMEKGETQMGVMPSFSLAPSTVIMQEAIVLIKEGCAVFSSNDLNW
jgi:hypothetical protein